MKRILIGVIGLIGLVVLSFTNSWGASGDQPVKLNSAAIGATVTVNVMGTASIRNLDKAIDSVSAAQNGNWTVSITGTPSVRYLDKTTDSISAAQSGNWTVVVSGTPSIRYIDQSTDSIKVYGNLGVAIKQDSTGQIYAITAPESGTNIRKVFTFSNVSAGVWVEIGSYTVTTGKSLKLFDAKATGRYAIDFKISDGVTNQELYLATSPSYAGDQLNIVRPVVIAAGTIVRVSVKADDAINSGTIAFGGFEY